MYMQIIKRLHYLNLDTALGAVIMSLFVSEIFHVPINWASVAALFLSVLLIYTFDHYQDAAIDNSKVNSLRLEFYSLNRRRLRVAILILVVCLTLSLFFIPFEVFYNGIILSAAVGFYFVLLKLLPTSFIFFKEFMVAVIYVLGVFLPAYTLGHLQVNSQLICIYLIVLILAVLNLLVFSIYDMESDKISRQPNITNLLGFSHYLLLGISFSMVNYFLIWSAYADILDSAQRIVLTLMTSVLVVLLILVHTRFRDKELIRVAGEFVFVLPVVLL